MALIEQLTEELINGNATAVGRLTSEALEQGIPPHTILEQGLIQGMNVVGIRFKNCEMFLPEVLTCARAMNAGVARLEPHLAAAGVRSAGKVVIGTVKGDLHDIGKNLVGIMLRGAGFQVIDLGVGVGAQKFVQAVVDQRPDILAMSALLTTTMMQMKTNIVALTEAGVRSTVKVMIGGAPVNRSFAEEIGADAYGATATEAVEQGRALMKLLRENSQ